MVDRGRSSDTAGERPTPYSRRRLSHSQTASGQILFVNSLHCASCGQDLPNYHHRQMCDSCWERSPDRRRHRGRSRGRRGRGRGSSHAPHATASAGPSRTRDTETMVGTDHSTPSLETNTLITPMSAPLSASPWGTFTSYSPARSASGPNTPYTSYSLQIPHSPSADFASMQISTDRRYSVPSTFSPSFGSHSRLDMTNPCDYTETSNTMNIEDISSSTQTSPVKPGNADLPTPTPPVADFYPTAYTAMPINLQPAPPSPLGSPILGRLPPPVKNPDGLTLDPNHLDELSMMFLSNALGYPPQAFPMSNSLGMSAQESEFMANEHTQSNLNTSAYDSDTPQVSIEHISYGNDDEVSNANYLPNLNQDALMDHLSLEDIDFPTRL